MDIGEKSFQSQYIDGAAHDKFLKSDFIFWSAGTQHIDVRGIHITKVLFEKEPNDGFVSVSEISAKWISN